MARTIAKSWKECSKTEERCKFIDKIKNDENMSVTVPMMELAIFIFMHRHMVFMKSYAGQMHSMVYVDKYFSYYFENVRRHAEIKDFCQWYNETCRLNTSRYTALRDVFNSSTHTSFNMYGFITFLESMWAYHVMRAYRSEGLDHRAIDVRSSLLAGRKVEEFRMYMYEVFPTEPFAQPSESILNHSDFPVMIKQYLDRTLPEEIFVDWMIDANNGDDRDVTIQHLRRRGPQTKQYVHLYGSHVFPVWAMRYF